MQYVIVVLLFNPLALCEVVGADARSAQIDDISRKHRDFAASQLKDDDPFVASAALDALAMLDFSSYEGQVREKLRRPLTDPSVEVALTHLIKRATPDDLKRVREIVVEAAKKGEEERKDDSHVVNGASTEFLAIEVLLASGDAKATEFAIKYLEETIKRNPGPGITQMDLALDLIGRYGVTSAAAKIRVGIVDVELQDAVMVALAKNGDRKALDTLKRRVETMQKVRPIIWDSQLVDKLALTDDDLKAIFRKGDRAIRIFTAGQLARKGHMEELRTVTQDVLAKPDAESKTLIEQMIGKYGDESFVLDLDLLASKEPNVFGRLSQARAIFQIIRRRGERN